ncbi:hypothetical protein V8E53_001531 [Lactarius tabidus]
MLWCRQIPNPCEKRDRAPPDPTHNREEDSVTPIGSICYYATPKAREHRDVLKAKCMLNAVSYDQARMTTPGSLLGTEIEPKEGSLFSWPSKAGDTRNGQPPIRQVVMDRPVTCRKSVTFDGKAKVGALVQRARTFRKQKLAEEAKDEALREQLALARACYRQDEDHVMGSRDENPDYGSLTNKSWVTSSEQDHQKKSRDRVM